jgi:hypothetical protein
MGIQSAPTREAAEQIMHSLGFKPAPVIPKAWAKHEGIAYWWNRERQAAGTISPHGDEWLCGWMLPSDQPSRAIARAIAREPLEAACWRIAANLGRLQKRWIEEQPNHEDFRVHVGLVMEALEGRGDVFQQLDDRPGYFHGNGSGPTAYHCLLRNVRNSPIYGPKLFASFRPG